MWNNSFRKHPVSKAFISTMLNPWFVTGFCAGEAAFTYSRHGDGDGFGLYFAVKLNKSEEHIISQLQEFFGVGTIYNVKATPPRKYSGYTKPALYYRVTRVSDLERIVEHFDKFPLVGRKLKVYNIWREMVQVKKKFRRPDNAMLETLALELSKLSNKNTKLKLFKEQYG